MEDASQPRPGPWSSLVRFLRQIPAESTFALDRFEPRMLCRLESAWVMAGRVPAGCGALPRHTHEVDQLYYVLSGTMQVRLGHDEAEATPGSLVYIPAGTPHENRNLGPGAELHLEILAPAPPPFRPVYTLTDSCDGPTGYYVTPVPAVQPGARHWLTELGTRSCAAQIAVDQPGQDRPGLRIHETDRVLCVLAGTLDIWAAGRGMRASRGTLVVLPAGVPHTAASSGDEVTRHLTLLLPTPAAGRDDPGRPAEDVLGMTTAGRGADAGKPTGRSADVR